MSIGSFGVTFGLDFNLMHADAHVSKVRQESGVVKGYFYVVALDSRLKFPIQEFMVEVLNDYKIAPSQLVPNSWRILVAFFISCKMMVIKPTLRMFRFFYCLKRR